MPALPNQPNVLRYDTVFQVGADTNVSARQYFTYAGSAPSAANCQALAQIAVTFAVAQFPQAMHPDNAFERVEVTDLTSPSAGAGQVATRAVGVRTGAPLAASSCVLINFTLNRRYRGGKPRIYLPWGVSTDLQTPQTWTTTFTSLASTVYLNYLQAIVTSVGGSTQVQNHVNISYYQGFTSVLDPVTGRTRDVPKVRPTAIPPDLITGTLINPNVGTQRRRIRA